MLGLLHDSHLSAGLGRNLPLSMSETAFPAALIGEVPRIGMPTGGASNTIRPPELHHGQKAHIRVGKVPDGLNKGPGFRREIEFHAGSLPRKSA